MLCRHCLVPEIARVLADTDTAQRHRRRVSKYDITVEEYARIFLAQAGMCAICQEPFDFPQLVVDHDHATGEVRGLLCHRCNLGLGLFRDNEWLLVNAVRYLRKPNRVDRNHGIPTIDAMKATATLAEDLD